MKRIALVAALTTSALTTHAAALTSSQFTMRACVNDAKSNPDYSGLSVGVLCKCVLSEFERDIASDPSRFKYDRFKNGYYSQKEEEAVERRAQRAIEGHFEYCAILQE